MRCCALTRYENSGSLSEEYKLGYVELEFVPNEDMYDMACQVQAMLDGQLGTKTRFALFEDLQAVYHEKRGILTEYQLIIQNNMFTEYIQTERNTGAWRSRF